MISCCASAVVFVIPDYTMSYMQQHFLNAAHNLKFGLYDSSDFHSGFYGPITYHLFSWWNTSNPLPFTSVKLYVLMFALINIFLISRLMDGAKNFSKACVSFLLIAQAYYLYVSPQQPTFSLTIVLYLILDNSRNRLLTKPNNLNYKLLSETTLCFIIIACLFLIKPHFIVYGILLAGIYIPLYRKRRFNILALSLATGITASAIFIWLTTLTLNYELNSYIEFLKIPASHGIRIGYFIALLAINLLIFIFNYKSSPLSAEIRRIDLAIFSLTSVPLAYASSKYGSDLTHVLPLCIMSTAKTCTYIDIQRKELNYKIRGLQLTMTALIIPYLILPLTIRSYGSTFKWYHKIDSHTIKSEINYFKSNYTCGKEMFKQNPELKSCISFGFGESSKSFPSMMYLSTILTNNYNYNLADIAVIRDKVDANVRPSYEELLGGEQVAYYLIPKGEKPFALRKDLDMITDEENISVLGEGAPEYFSLNYDSIDTSELYDLYRSKILF